MAGKSNGAVKLHCRAHGGSRDIRTIAAPDRNAAREECAGSPDSCTASSERTTKTPETVQHTNDATAQERGTKVQVGDDPTKVDNSRCPNCQSVLSMIAAYTDLGDAHLKRFGLEPYPKQEKNK